MEQCASDQYDWQFPWRECSCICVWSVLTVEVVLLRHSFILCNLSSSAIITVTAVIAALAAIIMRQELMHRIIRRIFIAGVCLHITVLVFVAIIIIHRLF